MRGPIVSVFLLCVCGIVRAITLHCGAFCQYAEDRMCPKSGYGPPFQSLCRCACPGVPCMWKTYALFHIPVRRSSTTRKLDQSCNPTSVPDSSIANRRGLTCDHVGIILCSYSPCVACVCVCVLSCVCVCARVCARCRYIIIGQARMVISTLPMMLYPHCVSATRWCMLCMPSGCWKSLLFMPPEPALFSAHLF